MLDNDLEKRIQEKLLDGLIEHMHGKMGDRMAPKGLGVTVEAPDADHLADGLDKAKDVLENGKLPVDSGDSDPETGLSPSSDDSSDDDRLLELLAQDEDEEDKKRR